MPIEQISLPAESNAGTAALVEAGRTPDWHFARRPFWLFSHLFAVAVVSLFVVLGLWQLDRLEQRRADNSLIRARTTEAPLIVDSAEVGDQLGRTVDFRRAFVTGTVVDADVARIANRSQGGVAGEYVAALLELEDGSLLPINRGFVPINSAVEMIDLPGGPIELSGWLRTTVKAEGWFAVADTGEGRLLPRFDTAALSSRVDQPLPSYFFQIAPGDAATAQFPDPVALPELTEGSHLSYAVQWFIFALLGSLFYVAVVRRRAHRADTDSVTS